MLLQLWVVLVVLLQLWVVLVMLLQLWVVLVMSLNCGWFLFSFFQEKHIIPMGQPQSDFSLTQYK